VNELCDKCPSRFELLADRHFMVYLESVLLWHPQLRFSMPLYSGCGLLKVNL